MIHVWDAASGAAVATMTGHFEGAQDVAFAPDGSLLATASGDATARVWDVGSGQPRSAVASPKSAASPRTPPSSQLERFISVSTARSNHAACAMAA